MAIRRLSDVLGVTDKQLESNDKKIKELEKIPSKGKPELIIVDARTKPSASKRSI